MPGENNQGQETEVEVQTAPLSTDAGAEEQSNLSQAAEALTEQVSNEDLPTDKPQSAAVMDFLNTLSGDEKPADETAGEQKPAEGEQKPAEGEQQLAEGQQQPVAKTPEQEEAELLEGVKSERGRERIKEVFATKKQLEQDVGEFKELITSTKMSPEQFAQTLEYGRLINSGNEQDLRVALEMIEQERTLIYQKLGVEAPGVDLLAGHDDLKTAIENMEITRERALELAKYRKIDQDKAKLQANQQSSARDQAEFQSTIQTAAQGIEGYLNTRAGEADHPARMQIITDHFKNPANLQAFITTYQPHQWGATIKMMYDGIAVPKAPVVRSPQPLRSRPAIQGNPSSAGTTPIDRIASHIDNMGI